MATFKGSFLSIVLIGRQNPQILSHDFLIKNKVIPEYEEPFKTAIETSQTVNKRPFSDFVSTPVLTAIRYGKVDITVEENRFQIRDGEFAGPTVSPIYAITRRYFVELLKYTPLKIGGLNFAGQVEFANEDDRKRVDDLMGMHPPTASDFFENQDVMMGAVERMKWKDGWIEVQFQKPKEKPLSAALQLNYEFEITDQQPLLNGLNAAPDAYAKFEQLREYMGLVNE